MFKGIQKKEIVVAASLAGLIALILAGYFYAGMAPGKGLRISPPDFAAINQQFSQKPPAESIDQISSASFMAVFGLNVSPTVIAATATEVVKTQKPAAVATPTAPVEVKPLTVDLEKIGYRLRGIVLEDGRSAAFVFVPSQKKVMVIREKASGTVRLLEAGLRNVKLQTPEGTGFLNLESARGTPGATLSPTPGMSDSVLPGFPQAPPPQGLPSGGNTPENLSGQSGALSPNAGANSIANQINQGQLRVSQQRGKFSVEVRQVPDSLKGYDIKPGDRIIGTDAGEFARSQDIARNLGAAGEQAHNLRVQRGSNIITIKAPPPPANASAPSNITHP